MEIALVSAPWPLFDRPSIQLGALKAYLCEHLAGASVHTHHSYLKVAAGLGYGLYGEISERPWLAEIPYAALLFPERTEALARFWRRSTRGTIEARSLPLSRLCRCLEKESREALDSVDWDRHGLVGLSICLAQLTASLYFLREIKRRAPAVKIVVGGSACAGALGQSLLETFSPIDYVVCGEGERPLLHLAGEWVRGKEVPSPFPGLISRTHEETLPIPSQAEDLNNLPLPDYTDYFQDLAALPPEKAFHPRIPLEMSRGCWWQAGGRGCTFCNLNLQWRGYRQKTPTRVARELDALCRRHGTLSFSFMDNLLPARDLEQICGKIEDLGKDFRLFAEIRATTDLETLRAMRRAGVRQVQVGIEALSSGLLRRLRKGTRALTNLEIMKHCEALDTPDLFGNLILEFPSSTEEDAAETLRTLEFALPFRPLKPATFWLGYESPVWQHPSRFGIRRRGNHPYYRHLFPPEILRRLTLLNQGYQGGIRRQRRIWQPVREKAAQWQEAYRSLHEGPGFKPILSYVDAGDFLIIRHRQPGRIHMTHRLRGTSREIYLFCERAKSVPRILERFPGLGEERLLPFVRMMEEKRLMFREGSRVLSLALRDP